MPILRVLLDENLPTKLKYRLADEKFEVLTVRDQNWLGKKNGELLKLMQKSEFDVLLSSDKNLIYQQNTHKYSIILLRINVFSNRYEDLLKIVPQITTALSAIKDKIEINGKPTYLELIPLDL
jgi:predicted nuclease of predicted toxin-antitoxin system